MIVRFVLWSLADSLTTIGELRRNLRDETVDEFEQVPGLLFTAWISDEITERWGAVDVWESAEAADQAVRAFGSARELIGKDPDVAEVFDLEATVSVVDELRRLGLAFDGD